MKFDKFERKMLELALDIDELEQAKVKRKNDYEKLMMQLYDDEIIGYLESVKQNIKHLYKSPVYCGIVKRVNDCYYVGDHKLDKYETIEFSTYSVLDDEEEGYDEERVIDDDFLKSIDIDVNDYYENTAIERYINIINDIDEEEYFVNARIGKVESDLTIRTDYDYGIGRDLEGVLVLIRR